MRRGEIYLADLGEPSGKEQAGKRPVVIVQNDVGNHYSPVTIVCPLTTKNKVELPTHIHLEQGKFGLKADSTILCEQIRVLDKTKMLHRCGSLDNNKVDELNNKLMIAIGLVNTYNLEDLHESENESCSNCI